MEDEADAVEGSRSCGRGVWAEEDEEEAPVDVEGATGVLEERFAEDIAGIQRMI